MTAASAGRRPFEGMLQILRYNLRFYVLAGVAAALALAAASFPLSGVPAGLSVGLAALVVLFSISSLAVAHYVYDRSALPGWAWLVPGLPAPPARWTVVHAGLDEATPALRRLFPGADGEALDIYDPADMPEPSIAVARRTTALPEPARPATHDALPVAEAECDLLVLFFVAHELRRAAAREGLFRELRRVLAPRGTLVLVEHPRDLPNLLAFGPGFLHFLPRGEWRRLADGAGLAVREEARVTPFVRVFFLERCS